MLIVDLSANNAEPNWYVLRQHVEGVFLKATEGSSYLDPRFASWRKRANAAGLRVGAYHFARPDTHIGAGDPIHEAQLFARALGKVERTGFRPALDFETLAPIGAARMAEWSRAFSSEVKKRLGVGVLFYSYGALIQSMRWPKTLGYGLWLATYGRNDGREHPFLIPSPWRKASAVQFTSRGRVAGCSGNVDVSRVLQPNAMLAYPFLGRL